MSALHVDNRFLWVAVIVLSILLAGAFAHADEDTPDDVPEEDYSDDIPEDDEEMGFQDMIYPTCDDAFDAYNSYMALEEYKVNTEDACRLVVKSVNVVNVKNLYLGDGIQLPMESFEYLKRSDIGCVNPEEMRLAWFSKTEKEWKPVSPVYNPDAIKTEEYGEETFYYVKEDKGSFSEEFTNYINENRDSEDILVITAILKRKRTFEEKDYCIESVCSSGETGFHMYDVTPPENDGFVAKDLEGKNSFLDFVICSLPPGCTAEKGDGCNPKCTQWADPDCASIACTEEEGDCCDLSEDGVCDADCPEVDPDCHCSVEDDGCCTGSCYDTETGEGDPNCLACEGKCSNEGGDCCNPLFDMVCDADCPVTEIVGEGGDTYLQNPDPDCCAKEPYRDFIEGSGEEIERKGIELAKSGRDGCCLPLCDAICDKDCLAWMDPDCSPMDAWGGWPIIEEGGLFLPAVLASGGEYCYDDSTCNCKGKTSNTCSEKGLGCISPDKLFVNYSSLYPTIPSLHENTDEKHGLCADKCQEEELCQEGSSGRDGSYHINKDGFEYIKVASGGSYTKCFGCGNGRCEFNVYFAGNNVREELQRMMEEEYENFTTLVEKYYFTGSNARDIFGGMNPEQLVKTNINEDPFNCPQDCGKEAGNTCSDKVCQWWEQDNGDAKDTAESYGYEVGDWSEYLCKSDCETE
ncbi:MAG: hypothetical protein ABIB71_01465 [Candidatus Woesearchaeota archaeon]